MATCYTVKEYFGIVKSLEKIEILEKKLKEDKAAIDANEKSKKKGCKRKCKRIRITKN